MLTSRHQQNVNEVSSAFPDLRGFTHSLPHPCEQHIVPFVHSSSVKQLSLVMTQAETISFFGQTSTRKRKIMINTNCFKENSAKIIGR